MMLKNIKTAFLLLIFFTVLTGFAYPFLITGIAQYFFPEKANGSLVERDGKIIGSQYIGQQFTSARYFWGRPSATTPFPYNAENSSGSNLGPMNPALLSQIKTRLSLLQSSNQNEPVPVDLVTASASGLDPDISPLAALYQIPRIAKARHMSENALKILVEKHVKKRCFVVFGAGHVNVLALNIDLDKIASNKGSHERRSSES